MVLSELLDSRPAKFDLIRQKLSELRPMFNYTNYTFPTLWHPIISCLIWFRVTSISGKLRSSIHPKGGVMVEAINVKTIDQTQLVCKMSYHQVVGKYISHCFSLPTQTHHYWAHVHCSKFAKSWGWEGAIHTPRFLFSSPPSTPENVVCVCRSVSLSMISSPISSFKSTGSAFLDEEQEQSADRSVAYTAYTTPTPTFQCGVL